MTVLSCGKPYEASLISVMMDYDEEFEDMIENCT